MGSLLDRVSRALYEAIVEPGIYFHKLMSVETVGRGARDSLIGWEGAVSYWSTLLSSASRLVSTL